jgi:hypothetical protein
MDETDNRTKIDGKDLFIIRNGRKIAKFEAGNGCRYFRES